MTFDFSRRRLLATLGLAAAPVAPAIALQSAAPAAPIEDTSTLTPATYHEAMTAIGWRAVAMLVRGKVCHVIEYGPDDPTEKYDSWEQFRKIQKRVPGYPESKAFWLATAHYLNDRGLFEEVARS